MPGSRGWRGRGRRTAVREQRWRRGRRAAGAEGGAGPFGTTDLYMVCVLELDESAGGSGAGPPELRPEPSEIAEAKWMPLSAFLGSRYYRRGVYGELLRAAAREAAAGDAAGSGLRATQLPGLGGKPETLYYSGGRGAASKL